MQTTMKFIKFFSVGFFCLLLSGCYTLAVSAADAPKGAPKQVPVQCMSSAYAEATTGTAQSEIAAQAEALLAELEDLAPEAEQSDTAEGSTNAFERSYLALRSKINTADFFASFDFLRASECIRKDVADLEALLSQITVRYQKALQDKKLNQSIEQKFAKPIATLREEIKKLRACGTVPGSVYYEARYEKKSCEPRQQEIFKVIRGKFKAVGEKLGNLFKKDVWKDIFSKEQWSNLVDQADKEAKGLANTWIKQHAIPTLLKLPAKEKAAPSEDTRKEEAAEGKNIAADQARQETLRAQQEALRSPTIDGALQGYAQAQAQGKLLLQYAGESVYQFFIVVLQSTEAEYWKQEVIPAQESVITQQKHLADLTKALK